VNKKRVTTLGMAIYSVQIKHALGTVYTYTYSRLIFLDINIDQHTFVSMNVLRIYHHQGSTTNCYLFSTWLITFQVYTRC